MASEIPLYLDPTYVEFVDDGLPKQIVHKTNYVAEGKGKIISQYTDKPRILALLGVFLLQIQETEDALFSIIDAYVLDTATGNALTVLGRILNTAANGLSEAAFRTVLRARIKVLRSNGKTTELLEIVRLISADGSEPLDVLYREFLLPGLSIGILSALGTIDPDTTLELLNQAKPGGVPLLLTYSHLPAAQHLRLSSYTGTRVTSARGFGSSVTPAQGGKLASARGGV